MAVDCREDFRGNLSFTIGVGPPARVGFNVAHRYQRDAPPAPVESEALGSRVDLLITGAGHTSTTWMIDFLSEHPLVVSHKESNGKDTCLGDKCGLDTRRLHRAPPSPSHLLLAKGPCNVQWLPFFFQRCPSMRVLFLVRNPLDYFASLTRRLPKQPTHNMLRWLADHQAAAQHWAHPRAHVTRYEDITSSSSEVRNESFHALFCFFGLQLIPELRGRYAINETRGTLESSRCYSSYVENRTQGSLHKQLRSCESAQPLLVNENLWRRDPNATAVAQAITWRVNQMSHGVLQRLATALGYVAEDSMLRDALYTFSPRRS